MKKLFTLLLTLSVIPAISQLNLEYKGQVNYDNVLSDVWGWVGDDDSEYAIVGVENGVSIVDVTDTENPTELFFIDGPSTIWRDIKTWGDYAYVINEASGGLLVIDMSDVPNSIDHWNWAPMIEGLGTLSTCHNIWIDEFGYAYLSGCNLNGGGVLYADVFTNPGQPEYVGKGPNEYAHDCFARDNKLYSCEIYQGVFSIYDVTDKTNTTLLGSQATQAQFTHNCWLSDDNSILFTTDEVGGATVGAYDVSDPTDIQELDQFAPLSTLGSGVIPHNVHVWSDWLIISYYTDGCILVDGSNPTNLIEVGNFDTFIPSGTGFLGAWGAYPYFPSGTVLVSDVGDGLYVLEPNYVNACWLEGTVSDAETTLPLSGAYVEILGTVAEEQSAIDGAYATGLATAGTYEVLVSRGGYEEFLTEVELENGVLTILDVELVPLIPFTMTGTVVDADTGDEVPFAKVSMQNEFFEYNIECDDAGTFTLPDFFEGEYEVFGGIWGYKTTWLGGAEFDAINSDLVIEIEEGYEDIFSLDLGWTVSGDAETGIWERGLPNGLDVGAPIDISPTVDSGDDGGHCYVTGNTTDIFTSIVTGGNTLLTSPSFDATGFTTPHVSFYSWYFDFDVELEDALGLPGYIMIDNGTETVVVDTLDYPELDDIFWEFREYVIEDYLTPTDNMTVSFEVNSSSGFELIAEAAMDHFKVTNSTSIGVGDTEFEGEIAAFPNPANDQFALQFDLINASPNASIEIWNAQGQLVDAVRLPSSRGIIYIGDDWSPGFYVAKLRSGDTVHPGLKLIKQ